jgi:FolB domain-containing protein
MPPDRSTPGDTIHIEALELAAHVGVTDEERAAPQRITASITIWPVGDLREVADDLTKTVNYAAVCQRVRELIARDRHKLIETVAEVIAGELLGAFAIARIMIEVRKFILSDVDYVSVKIAREKTDASAE